MKPTPEHSVHIPSSALQRGGGNVPEVEVLVVASVINSSHFKVSDSRKRTLISFTEKKMLICGDLRFSFTESHGRK